MVSTEPLSGPQRVGGAAHHSGLLHCASQCRAVPMRRTGAPMGGVPDPTGADPMGGPAASCAASRSRGRVRRYNARFRRLRRFSSADPLGGSADPLGHPAADSVGFMVWAPLASLFLVGAWGRLAASPHRPQSHHFSSVRAATNHRTVAPAWRPRERVSEQGRGVHCFEAKGSASVRRGGADRSAAFSLGRRGGLCRTARPSSCQRPRREKPAAIITPLDCSRVVAAMAGHNSVASMSTVTSGRRCVRGPRRHRRWSSTHGSLVSPGCVSSIEGGGIRRCRPRTPSTLLQFRHCGRCGVAGGTTSALTAKDSAGVHRGGADRSAAFSFGPTRRSVSDDTALGLPEAPSPQRDAAPEARGGGRLRISNTAAGRVEVCADQRPGL